MTDPTSPDIAAAKRALRRKMRQLRLEVESPSRSARICAALVELVDPATTALAMVYDAVPGEPDLTAFVDWCGTVGVETIAPDPTPIATQPAGASVADLVIVPGLAFTLRGERLGQGGGWYDRVLARTRPDRRVIGVCFGPQVVAVVPTEPHDVVVDLVITDLGVHHGSGVN